MSTSVVIADDHAMFREGLRTVLQGVGGIEVVGEAGNGRDAVRLARKLAPDIVVMDVAMPELNGIEATRQIRESGSRTRVLALSMHSDGGYIKRMLQAGASGYIIKASAAEELSAAIRAVAANKVYVSPEVVDVMVGDYVAQLAGGPSQDAPGLSTREVEVLQLIAEGKSTSAIAALLHLSSKTVQTHRQRIMDKLSLNSVAELTKYAVREGITSLDA